MGAEGSKRVHTQGGQGCSDRPDLKWNARTGKLTRRPRRAESIRPSHFSTATLAIMNPLFRLVLISVDTIRRRAFLVPKRSAGILMFRKRQGDLEVFLVDPGGPFWVKKDLGAWTIPKGEYQEGEDPLEVAKREFEEETGWAPGGRFLDL